MYFDTYLIIDEFSRKFAFKLQTFRGDIKSGESIYNELNRLYRFTDKQKRYLIHGRFKIESILPVKHLKIIQNEKERSKIYAIA